MIKEIRANVRIILLLVMLLLPVNVFARYILLGQDLSVVYFVLLLYGTIVLIIGLFLIYKVLKLIFKGKKGTEFILVFSSLSILYICILLIHLVYFF